MASSQCNYTFGCEELVEIPATLLYDLVLNIEDYPKFIPWCNAVNVISRRSDLIVADLVAGFMGLRGSYTSNISFTPPSCFDLSSGWICVSGEGDSIFKRLNNRWEFIPVSENATIIKFWIDFEFKSVVFKKAFEIFHKKVQKTVMGAFKKKAFEVFYSKTLKS
mgnify:CR=1 FL=1